MPAIEYRDLTSQTCEENSLEIRKRVLEARRIQAQRFPRNPGKTNAMMSQKELRIYCAPTENAKKLLERAMRELGLSARGYHKILKIARTIADLGHSEQIEEAHIAEAIQYRTLDRNWFG